MTHHDEVFPDPHHDSYSKTLFGFWVYLLSDFILFATLMAVYVVLRNNTYGGPPIRELTNPNFVLFQTVVMLCTSFTAGIAGAYAHRKDKIRTILWLSLTAVLGIAFLMMEFRDFTHWIATGNSWKRSGFLSALFSLLGTHALHIVFAVLWSFVLMPLVVGRGLKSETLRRISCLKMFWQFLNVVWVFIYTIVYLIGATP